MLQADRQWLLGAVNVDEDLHYSSYFLTASTQGLEQVSARYSQAVSCYNSNIEHYFVDALEAETVACNVIRSIEAGALDVEDFFLRLDTAIDDLVELGTRYEIALTSGFADLQVAKEFYLEHDETLSRLYSLARLPEVLDRGKPWFTQTLLESIGEHLHASSTSTQVRSAFLALTGNDQRDTLELLGINRLSELSSSVRESLTPAEFEEFLKNPGSIYQLGSPELLDSMRNGWLQYGYLYYHGYTRRTLPSIDEYVSKVSEECARSASNNAARSSLPNVETGVNSISTLGSVDSKLLCFYRLSAESKLKRRLAQLKIFPLLDFSLQIFARHFGVTERAIRHALPAEIKTNLIVPDFVTIQEWTERVNGCVVYWKSVKSPEIVADSSLAEKWRRKALVEPDTPARDTLVGEPAMSGFVRARCVIKNRTAIFEPENVRGAYVLVSEATDLDMIGLVQSASAVVTARGGLTSHAAIICRELGVPAVVGVKNLLQFLKDGTFVEVDGTRGTVKILN